MVRAGALGDVLLLRRTIAALERGGYDVTLLAPLHSAAALAGPGASEVRRICDWERPDVAPLVAGEAPIPTSLRRDLDGCAVVLAYTRNEALISGLRGLAGTVIVRDPAPGEGAPAAQWFARSAADLGLAAPAPPRCVPTPAEAAAAERWLARLPRRFLALHAGSGSPSKNWPAARFLEVAARVRPRGPWFVALGPAEEAIAPTFRADERCVVGKGLGVRLLGAVLAQAGVYVGNDSGVSHLAAAWGAPTVALFGPTDGRVWAPDGENVRAVQSRTGDMAGIAVDDVARALRSAAPEPPSG